ncbi:MAG TPA: phosphotransferase [Mycoplana sp.]|jgi:Ser/Thr protein kinase RdoA (MazF antagonist)|nr:phosphotransferase [Mycoplana sp.]
MTTRHPSISDLLARDAVVVHSKWRFRMQKRIVELNGRTYVLYRFRRKRTKARFEDTIRRLEQAGIAIQSICARTSTFGEYLRHGHWVALSYLPGEPIAKRVNRAGLVSLGRTIARLNAIEGPPQQALFGAKRPVLPHETYLARDTQLTESQRRWIRKSHARLQGLAGAQLTHGDLFSGNIIQNDDNSVSLIDYELLAHDLAGIELAATLLRPFCRTDKRRRILLAAYLAACSPKLRQAWDVYGRDFLFAAAARLALARQDRVRHVTRLNRILAARRLLSRRGEELTGRYEANLAVIRSAQRNEAYYVGMARTMIELCLVDSETGPLDLLQLCHQRRAQFR